jgi:thioredoxin 1
MGWMIGAVVGGLLGYGFYRLVGCKTGACPLTAKPWVSVLYGIFVGLFLVSSSLNGAACSKKTVEARNPNVKEFTADNWTKEVLESKKTVLVDFWAPWCYPCRIQGPIVDKVADETKGSAVVGKLNVDENGKIAGLYGIRSIPTLIVFKNGKAQARMSGVTDGEVLKLALKVEGSK